MKTLYLRNVPDDVSERLAALAAREGLSVTSFAVRELAQAARRADNRALLDGLPDLGVSAADVVGDLEAGRSAR
jgi:plasmid stability protein